ncbi:MAG: hypothetical protein EXS46_00830 [Candidatus Taylorbacteria bacterium]|nr:hypothetical protein [Candidatus Taylorbacteria bacterium]
MNLKNIWKLLLYLFAIIGFILVAGFFAVKFGLTNTTGIIDNQREGFYRNIESKPAWSDGEEWQVFETAVTKDKVDIERAATLAGVTARLIVSQLVSEQLRLFYTNREIFKTVFSPLKILGNQSQFSWGVMGLKQETAIEIEKHLENSSSPYYLGKNFEKLLNPITSDPDSERFKRITDENSRFYSYLYTGLYLKEIETQWQKAGFDISNRPEILSTLFNIGFEHSTPNINPQVGGSEIKIGEKIYSFGGLSAEFYYSNELLEEFPRKDSRLEH